MGLRKRKGNYLQSPDLESISGLYLGLQNQPLQKRMNFPFNSQIDKVFHTPIKSLISFHSVNI